MHGRTWRKNNPVRAEHVREGKWTGSIAARSRKFVEVIKGEPGMKAKGRRICGTHGEPGLRNSQASCSDVLTA